ncbi:MAG: InlB B-repeat-containing protein, partial [Acholeplasmatales bacterium]|nr:InlB B-repeat-containing protein [Acholeplasmatales bacterium]
GGTPDTQTQLVFDGDTVLEPTTNPTKAEDDNFVYTFGGWYTSTDGGVTLSDTAYDFSTKVTGILTLYAKWNTTEKYLVEFDVNGGNETVDSQRIVAGQNATEPETIPTKEADAQYTYTFAYWYAEDPNTAFDFANTPITGDTTLYAKWDTVVNKYTVTFDTDGGSTVNPIQNVEYGSLIENPGVPTKTATPEYSYTFEYWYVDGLDTSFDFTKDTIVGNLTLCAKWTPVKNKYTVTFDTNGGTTVNPISNVEYGSTITAPTAPEKAEDENYTYTFEGWYKDSGLQTSFDFTNDTITGATTLYAKWTPTAIQKYTYTFYNEDGSVVKTETIKEGELIVAPTTNPTKAEDSNFTYTFLGWYDKANAGNKVTTFGAITGDVSYYAQYLGVAKLTVSFVVNQGDQQFESVKVASGSSVTLPTANTIEGYRFDGWYLEDTYETKYTNQAITSATTLYGNYVQQINVTFIADGVEYLVSSIDNGSKVSEPTAPTKDGYYLSSWQLDGVDFDFNTTIDENITLIAVFEEVKETENVGFGGSYTSWQTLFANSTETDDKGRKILGTAGVGVSMNGFTFDGKSLLDSNILNTNASVITIQIPNNGSSINMSATWGSSNDSGVIRVYKNGNLFYESETTYSKNTTTAVTLALTNLSAGTYEIKAEKTNTTGQAGLKVSTIYYSRFVEYVDISYVTNSDQTIESTRIRKGNTLDELPTLIDKSGYRFIGWYTTEDFQEGTEFNITSAISSNTTLYVKWEELTAEDIVTVSFDVNVDGQTIDSVDIEKGTKLSQLPILNIEGYRLVGWFTNQALSQAFDIDTYIFNEDTTLYADYIEVFDVTFLDQDGVLIKTVTVDIDTKVTESITIPYIEGYKFSYWKNTSNNQEFDITEEYIAADYTLQAVYEVDTNPVAKLSITSAQGLQEAAYVTFNEYKNSSNVAADGYSVYINGNGYNNKKLDENNVYITKSGSTYRADLMGIKAGSYSVIVLPIFSESEIQAAQTSSNVTISAYDRSGYAHFNYSDGVGAYKDDGTLKDNAIVLYVTDENKNTISLSFGGVTVTGIGNILNSVGADNGSGTASNGGAANTNQGILKKLGEAGIPLVVRFVGCVSDSGLYAKGSFTAANTSLINGLTKFDSADYGGTEGDNGHMARMKSAKDVTLEGVGNDATIDGWGFHFMCESSAPDLGKSFEVRNLKFINTPEDAIGMEGVQASKNASSDLSASVERCWIHNNEFYGPTIVGPAESDKKEGDGSCDFKRGQFLTVSYNYFEGCHKTNLVGSADYSLQFNLTYHHNFWYMCKARGPLTRRANVHMYNNIFYGQTDYAVNTRADAYIFTEYNQFYLCKSPFAVEGGAIKSYNDNISSVIWNKGSEPTYVTDKSQTVSNNCQFSARGVNYSQFDTDSSLSYIPTNDYDLQEDIVEARKVIYARCGVAKSELIDPSTVTMDDISLLNKMISNPTINNLSVGQTVTPGKLTKTIYAFKITSYATATISYASDADASTGVLCNQAGVSLLKGSGTVVLAPGIYWVQANQFQPGDSATLAQGSFKEFTINSLTLSEYDSSALNAELIANYNNAVANIPSTITYTDSCYSAINAAKNAYINLGASLQSEVDYSPVTTALNAYKIAGEAYVEGLIDDIVLPVTASNSSAIITARTAYNALLSRISDASVSNYATLVEAESQMSSLAVDIFLTNANAIPATIDYTNECNTLITNAEVAYANLDENQVKQSEVVTAYAKVTAARTTYNNLEAATSVTALIAAANSVATYEAAYNAYNELTADQKALVQGYDNMVVTYVIALIQSISSPVTAADAATINKARAVYDALSSENKADVTNYNVLVAAEEELASVVQEYTKSWSTTTEPITAAIGTTTDGFTYSANDKTTMKIRNSKGNYIKLDNIGSSDVTINFVGALNDTNDALNGVFEVVYEDGTSEQLTFTFNSGKASTTVNLTINNGKTVKSVSFIGSTENTGKNAVVTSISITYKK